MTDELKAVKKSVNNDLIERLEKLLQQARSGELKGVVYVGLWDDEQTFNNWVLPKGSAWKCASLIGELYKAMTALANTADGIDSRIIKDV